MSARHALHRDGVGVTTSKQGQSRAACLFLLSSTAHELLLTKIANRTFWPNAVILVPLHAAFLCCALSLLSFLSARNARFRNIINRYVDLEGFQPLRVDRSLPVLGPLAAASVASTTLFLLQAGYLPISASASVSVSMTTLICPHILIL